MAMVHPVVASRFGSLCLNAGVFNASAPQGFSLSVCKDGLGDAVLKMPLSETGLWMYNPLPVNAKQKEAIQTLSSREFKSGDDRVIQDILNQFQFQDTDTVRFTQKPELLNVQPYRDIKIHALWEDHQFQDYFHQLLTLVSSPQALSASHQRKHPADLYALSGGPGFEWLA